MSVEEPSFDFLEGVEHPKLFQGRPTTKGDNWKHHGSSFHNYCAYAPAGAEDRIKAMLGKFSYNVALDIAGGRNAQAIQDLLSKNLIDKGIVTNYLDYSDETKGVPGLFHISGDLIKPETWREIIARRREHAPEGFSLVMFRPIAGLPGLPLSFYRGAADIVLDNIRPGGALLSEIPDFTPSDHPLCESLKQRADIAHIYAPKDFQVLPTALILKK